MGDTPTFRLPYPEGSDPVNVPQDLKDLADRVDYLLGLLTVGPAVAYANLGSGSRPVNSTADTVLATLNRPLVVPDGHEGMFLANLYSQFTFTDPALNKTAVAWLQWQKDGGAWVNALADYMSRMPAPQRAPCAAKPAK